MNMVVSRVFLTRTPSTISSSRSQRYLLPSRQIIAEGELANVFKIFEDIPIFWDAWDIEIYHLQKGWDATVGRVKVVERGPLVFTVEVTHPITETSTLKQRISVDVVSKRVDFDTTVDWNENRKILVCFSP